VGGVHPRHRESDTHVRQGHITKQGFRLTLPQRQVIKKVALSRPGDHNLPFSTRSLSKLAEFFVAEGVVDDISHEGLRVLLRKEEVSFQAVKTWKQSTDPEYEAKKKGLLTFSWAGLVAIRGDTPHGF
jgi:hypothetical protein